MSLRREDNITSTDDHRIESAESDLDRCHQHYKNVLKAIVDTAAKDRVLYLEHDLACIMEQVGERLAHEAAQAIEELNELLPTGDHSYTPKDSEQVIAAEAERLADSFRPKKLGCSKLLLDALRPVPMNPATKGW